MPKDLIVASIRLTPMRLSQDFADYERLVAGEPRREIDFMGAVELRHLLRQDIEAWLARSHDGTVLGWCAAMLCDPHRHDDAPIHLLGTVVHPSQRRRGIGHALVAARLQHYGNVDFTAAVAPGNVASEGLLRSFGFTRIAHGAQWNTWKLSRKLARLRVGGRPPDALLML